MFARRSADAPPAHAAGSRSAAPVAIQRHDPGDPGFSDLCLATIEVVHAQTTVWGDAATTLPETSFAWWSTAAAPWVMTPRTYTVSIGDSSAGLALRAALSRAAARLRAGA